MRFLAVSGLCISMAVIADNQTEPEAGVEVLETFLDQVVTLRAQFDQSLLDDQWNVVQESRGTLLIKRPGKFRWDYTEPYEQLILSDGVNLWIFDADLEQASVRRIDESLAATPAMLLSGRFGVRDSFDVARVEQDEELLWIHLLPKVRDTDFRAMSVGLENGELRVMELLDSLDQVTRLRFSSLIRNPPLEDELFSFSPPEGVDVIGELADSGIPLEP